MSRSGREFRESDKFNKSVRQQQERRLRTSERYEGIGQENRQQNGGNQHGNDSRRNRRAA